MTEDLTTPAGCACRATCQLLNVRDVAGLLKIHQRTVWRLSAMAETGQGDFPRPLRLGEKTLRWRLLELERYLAALAGGTRP